MRYGNWSKASFDVFSVTKDETLDTQRLGSIARRAGILPAKRKGSVKGQKSTFNTGKSARRMAVFYPDDFVIANSAYTHAVESLKQLTLGHRQ